VYPIETNYRSVPEILTLSNASIRANRQRFEKELKAVRKGAAMLPALVAVEDPSSQAQFVSQRILELRDEGMDLEEVAVLYRAHHQSLELQMELTSRGIPFQITSGLRFFEQAHIKDIGAFLRFVTNRKDEVSFKRMVMLLPGIGAKGAETLWRAWAGTGWLEREELPPDIAGTVLDLPAPKKSRLHWEQLAHTLGELVVDGEFARPADMLFSVLEGVYRDYLLAAFDNAENREQDIEQLRSYSERFDDVLDFLAQLSLMSAVDGQPTGSQAEPDPEHVTLSSVHQAKGLEWKAVFVIWLTDGMFPNGRILDADDEEMLEEERRLFYVALTRAKDELYLVYPQINPKSYTGDVIQRPSRFLDDCPGELLEEWNVGSAW
jgi:DNA helicase-2/ATP-dependent DNA helicase PcrA